MRVRFGVVLATALLLAPPAGAVDITYVYDALGRLIQVVYPSGKTITYTYDDAGNIVSVTVTP